jgi:superfamily II DNA or RNA helicase
MQRELALSLPWLSSHVAERGTAYDPTEKDRTLTGRPDVLFLNYAKLPGWAEALTGARTVIFDEAQELRTGPGTHRYEAAQRLAWPARYVIGLTATPVYNYGGEVWNLYNVIAPDTLGDREEFIREWGAGERSGKVTVRDPAALGTHLRTEGLMLARTRADVGRELPPVIALTQSVEADPREVERLSGNTTDIARLIVDSTTAGRDRFKLAGELDWRLRQATGLAKAPLVAGFVRLLLESEDRIVLYGWHRAVYDRWVTLLSEFGPRLYTGTETTREKERAVEAFRDPSDPCRILILSLRAGAGLDGLQEAAKVCVFGELDWSPGIHHQCIGRLARDGQGDDPVVAYYLVAESGSDPVIAQVLQLKRGQAEPLMDPNARTFGHTDAGADRMRMLAESVLAAHGERPTERPDAIPQPGPGQGSLL